MSRLPSRLEMNSRFRPSGSHSGEVLSDEASVTRAGSPPVAATVHTELGAMFPMAFGAYTKAELPDTKASREPSGDQANEWGWSTAAIRVTGPPATARTWISRPAA